MASPGRSTRQARMSALLSQRRMRWLGHVCCMEDERIPKDVLYDENASGTRHVGRPALWLIDACKRYIKSTQINIDSWEYTATARSNWRHAVQSGMRKAEERRNELWTGKRERRRERPSTTTPLHQTVYTCTICSRDCHSKTGLLSHIRCCAKH